MYLQSKDKKEQRNHDTINLSFLSFLNYDLNGIFNPMILLTAHLWESRYQNYCYMIQKIDNIKWFDFIIEVNVDNWFQLILIALNG